MHREVGKYIFEDLSNASLNYASQVRLFLTDLIVLDVYPIRKPLGKFMIGISRNFDAPQTFLSADAAHIFSWPSDVAQLGHFDFLSSMLYSLSSPFSLLSSSRLSQQTGEGTLSE